MTIELTKSEQAFVGACEVRPHGMTTIDLVAIIRKLQASRSSANSCTNAEREQYERTIELQNARIRELGRTQESDEEFVERNRVLCTLSSRVAELDTALHALHKIGYDPTDEDAAQAWQNAGKVLGLKVAQ